ncbi:hypothetical protein THAOC_27069, partial [Thalassiosira oceanica]
RRERNVFALQLSLLTPADPATTTQQQQERINAGPEVSTFPDFTSINGSSFDFARLALANAQGFERRSSCVVSPPSIPFLVVLKADVGSHWVSSTQLNHSCRIYGADLLHFVGTFKLMGWGAWAGRGGAQASAEQGAKIVCLPHHHHRHHPHHPEFDEIKKARRECAGKASSLHHI